MKRESLFYKILSAIHIVFFTSICCFGVIFLSATLLMLPALCAAFEIGKGVLKKEIDITDSIVRTYFREFKDAIETLRYVPLNLIFLLNVTGMWYGGLNEVLPYYVACMAVSAFLLTFCLYIAGYRSFVSREFKLMDVAFACFLKPMLLIPLFAAMVLLVFFFGVTIAVILFFTGTFFLFAVEVVILIHLLYFEDMLGRLDEDNEFCYLIKRDKGEKKSL
ncbi:MAG: hypothetical protein Q4G60_05525 [bacterium]|nr:hypothetical protein [bacterium]